MTEPPFDLGQIRTSVGAAVVVHRAALAVEPRDGLTGRPATGVRVGRETARSRFDRTRRRRGGPLDRPDPAVPLEAVPGSRFLLRYAASVRPTVVVRLDGAAGRWVRRRLAVEVRPLADAAAADPPVSPPSAPPPGPYVPVASRLLRPSLLPGAAYPLPRGTTAVRFRVTRAGAGVPWTRVLAFGALGTLIGWGHGDEHGEVVVVLPVTGTPNPPAPGRFLVALRVFAPPGAPPVDAPLESVPLFGTAGPAPDLMRGIARPSGYLQAPDRVRPCTVGELTVLSDQVLP